MSVQSPRDRARRLHRGHDVLVRHAAPVSEATWQVTVRAADGSHAPSAQPRTASVDVLEILLRGGALWEGNQG